MKRFARLFGLVAALVLAACRDNLPTVEQALEAAGPNRAELERVLEHYGRAEPYDEEKHRAAAYLIRYMPGHRSMAGDYEAYYDRLDLLLAQEMPLSRTIDSVEYYARRYRSRISFRDDIRHIDADYLIRNIDRAFEQWRNGKWARHLDFEQFCEYLLPYTCSSRQPLNEWRDSLRHFAYGYLDHLDECYDYEEDPRAAVCRVNSQLKRMAVPQNWIHAPHGYPVYRPSTFLKMPGALCEEYAEMATMIMRSKGLPVAIDFTPQWPDRQYGHTWCVMYSLRGRNVMFNPFASNPDFPHLSHSRYAKIFRRTYRVNEEYLDVLMKNRMRRPLFKEPFFRDVTGEYMETSDLSIELLPGAPRVRTAFIAVFDNFGWQPIYWGRVENRNARFERMGRNVIYMAMGYRDEGFFALSYPFHVDTKGGVTYVRIDTASRCDLEIRRKAPMYQHVFQKQETLHGGIIQASDFADFRQAETVARLPVWSLTSGVVPVSRKKAYRYWRFCAEEGSVSDMAELYFYRPGDVRPSDAEVIGCAGDAGDASQHTLAALVDGDPLTYYSACGMQYDGALDFGEPQLFDRVAYIRRGDGNAICPGDDYEIYFWNNSDWELHSRHAATEVRLNVKELPARALCFIRGSRGYSQRIFTWENGRVVWH